MKILFFFAMLACSGCDSLDNPAAGLLNTGRDKRTFNATTGQYEWPSDDQSHAGSTTRGPTTPSR